MTHVGTSASDELAAISHPLFTARSGPAVPFDYSDPGPDLGRPNAARMYDYMLGGSHNFGTDRRAVDRLLQAVPDAADVARANRAFLARAVRFLVAAGIRQFIDVGSGIPTRGNVHEIAQRAAPDARVLSVDVDPVAVAHSRAVLAGNERARAIRADVRHPEQILSHPELRSLLDLSQPFAVLLVAVLHFVADADEPAQVVAQFRDALPPGGYVVISHGTADSRPDDGALVADAYRATSTPLVLRSREQIVDLFTGLDLVPPGVVWATEWHPDHPNDVGSPQRHPVLVGLGHKP